MNEMVLGPAAATGAGVNGSGRSHAETLTVVVTAIRHVTPIIKEFTLRRPDGGELPAFAGGCHVVVVMEAGSRKFHNPYSLLSSPRDLSEYRIAVRKLDDGRGGSCFMHEQVKVGTTLQIAHPVNLFPLAHLARRHILIAGGVGITPMLAMIDDLRHGDVPYELHYAVRGPGHDHYGLRLKEIEGDRVHLYYDSRGELMKFAEVLADRPLGTHVYVCGPEGMIEGVVSAAHALGWADSHIHFEKFSAPPVGEPFEVFLARSKLVVHVPSELSLLEAMEAAGVDAPYLCRGGVCGQCETAVLDLDGELLHNDHYLSDEDKKAGTKIMPCVSRARCSRLVLDR